MRFALAALLLLAACHREAPPPAAPDEAYKAFVATAAAVREGREPKQLLELFDAPTRAALTERAKAAAHASGDDVPNDAAYQLVLGSANVPPLAQVSIVSQSGDTATLQVTTDGGPGGTVKMVREAGRWRVHLDAIPGS